MILIREFYDRPLMPEVRKLIHGLVEGSIVTESKGLLTNCRLYSYIKIYNKIVKVIDKHNLVLMVKVN